MKAQIRKSQYLFIEPQTIRETLECVYKGLLESGKKSDLKKSFFAKST